LRPGRKFPNSCHLEAFRKIKRSGIRNQLLGSDWLADHRCLFASRAWIRAAGTLQQESSEGSMKNISSFIIFAMILTLGCLFVSYAQVHTFPALDTNNIFTGSNTFPFVVSSTVNSAQNGVLRLATTDAVLWRNGANNGDVGIGHIGGATGNVPADTISNVGLPGILYFDAIIPSTATAVATSGSVRLASNDAIEWRNNANNNDIGLTKNTSDVFLLNGVQVALTIASGTATMTTAAIAGGACGTTVTVVASGAATTDAIAWSFNAAVGINPGELNVTQWPTSGNVNFQYCNETGAPITPTAATINWRVVR